MLAGAPQAWRRAAEPRWISWWQEQCPHQIKREGDLVQGQELVDEASGGEQVANVLVEVAPTREWGMGGRKGVAGYGGVGGWVDKRWWSPWVVVWEGGVG